MLIPAQTVDEAAVKVNVGGALIFTVTVLLLLQPLASVALTV